MAKEKSASRTAKKKAAGRTKKVATPKVPALKVAARAAARPRSRPPAARKIEPTPSSPEPMVGPAISDAQSQVVASKFATVEMAPLKPRPRPTLPSSYGESHLLLLVRDPQTLFAAWDMAPSTTEALKARLGRRGFAVSTLTLRLIRAGGGLSVVHVGKKARSRYLKFQGGPSFIAEIGFTTPAGRFEFVARSAPCFVPMGPLARQESIEAGRRAVLGYREARTVAKRGGLPQNPGPGATRGRGGLSTEGSGSPAIAPVPRVLGGASDLYRR